MILFDLDNTLIPSEEAYNFALEKIFGYDKTSYLEARQNVKDNLGEESPASHNRILYFKRYLELKNEFSSHKVLQLVQGYEGLMLEYLNESWRQLGYDQLLQKWSKIYRLVILTNENLRTQLLKMRIIDPYGKIFSDILTSEEVGKEKPQLKNFQTILNRSHVAAKDSLLVGDSVVCDLQPAKELGFGKIIQTTEFISIDKNLRFDFQRISLLPELEKEFW